MNATAKVTVEMITTSSIYAGPCDVFCSNFGAYMVSHAALDNSFSRVCAEHLSVGVGVMMQDGERVAAYWKR